MPAPRSRTMIISASTSLAAYAIGTRMARRSLRDPQQHVAAVEPRALEARREPALRAQPLDVAGDLGGERVVRAQRRGAAVGRHVRGDEAGRDRTVGAELGDRDAGLARVGAVREQREVVVAAVRGALAEARDPRGAISGAGRDRREVVDERAEAVEDRLAAMDLDAAQAVMVGAHDRVGAVLDGVARQLELVALEHLQPA